MSHNEETAQKQVDEVANFLEAKLKEFPNVRVIHDNDEFGDFLRVYYEYRDEKGHFKTEASRIVTF